MYKILKKRELVPNIFLMDIEAPRVAKSCKPGEFVIVKDDEKGERIPLTICDYDAQKGTVTIVFQIVGAGTMKLAKLEAGDFIRDFVGPLGQPSELTHETAEELKKKKILFVAGGVGTAPVYPQVKWLKSMGVDADVIIGARNKDLIIEEEKMRGIDPDLIVVTDDGSYGEKALVTEPLAKLCESGVDQVVAIGPSPMMKFCVKACKPTNTPILVSLNTIMIDGTGMCGGCRVIVGGETKFVCVDGPEFDGYLVDWDNMMKRQKTFKKEETEAHHKCHIDLQIEEGQA